MTQNYHTVIPPGASMKRLEDEELIQGQGRYTDNLKAEKMVHLHMVRSPHAHAKVGHIETSAALEMLGVLAIYTVEDLIKDGVRPYPVPAPPPFSPPHIIAQGYHREDGQPMKVPVKYALAQEEVRYVGECVVAILAETPAQAVDAAEMVEIDYEILPAVSTIGQASAPDAPEIWEGAPGNVLLKMELGDPEKTQAAFNNAAHVTRLELTNSRLISNTMEPRSYLCEKDPQSQRYTLHTGHQSPVVLRGNLTGAIFGWEPEKLRVVVGHMGGGFGTRNELYPEEILTVYAASKQERPVKWRASRSEDFVATNHGRDQVSVAELACDAEGHIQGMRIKNAGNSGGQPGGGICIPLVVGSKIVTSLYHVPVFHYEARMYMTNTMATGAYRGAGRPEAIYLMERLMEKTAHEMKMDSVEFRRRNLIPSQAMPYTTANGEVYDSGEFEKVLDAILVASDWNGYPKRKKDSEARHMRRGRAVSCYIEWTGAFWFEEVTTEAQRDGTVVLYTGTQNMGQGLQTSFTQILSEKLQLPASQIKVVQGDTDVVKGVGSVGSRSLYIGGSAIVEGAEKFIETCKELASHALEAAKEDIFYQEGRFGVVGTDTALDLAQLASQQEEQKIAVYSKTTLVNEKGVGLPSWPNGCQVVEVEIDPETGDIRIDRHWAMDDVGNIVNPMIVEGQVQGGIVQSIGQAFYEEAYYDETGQLLSGSFLDYAVPKAHQVPRFTCEFVEGIPCKTNPLGAKGVGELGTVGATPALVNAVFDALRDKDVSGLNMPLTPQKIWEVLQT